MSKVKVLMLSLLAVFAVGAIASASASALVWEECLNEKVTGTKYTTSSCATESATGTFGWMPIEKELKLTSEGEEQELSIPSAGIKITCSKAKDKGNLKLEGTDESTELVYTGCKINISGCSVVKTSGQPNGTIEVPKGLKTKLITVEKGGKLVVQDEFKPASGETFVTLEIAQKEKEGKPEKACGVLAIKDEVKGTTLANVEGETLNALGEGTLTTDGLASEYIGKDTQKLESGNAFRAS